MPNFLAHHLLIKDLYVKNNTRLPYDERGFLKNNFLYLFWGSQGPDPLFYNGVLPHNGLHLITSFKMLGNKLHKDDGEKLFTIMINHYNELNENKDEIKSFILGQFAHYLLDSITHPFILYESGFNLDGRIKGEYHYCHAHYEMLIDTSLAKKFDIEMFNIYPYEYLYYTKDTLKIIDSFFIDVLKEYFNDNKIYKKVYSNGVKNMFSLVKFVNEGSNIRPYLFFKSSLSALRIEKNEIKEDILNLSHEKWYHPVTKEEFTSSFIDLFNIAEEKLSSLYLEIKNKEKLNINDFKKYLGGLDYYGKEKDSQLKYWKNNIINNFKNKENNI